MKVVSTSSNRSSRGRARARARLCACAAVAVLSSGVACSKEQVRGQSAEPAVANLQPPAQTKTPLTPEQRAHELLPMADVQIRDLQDSRDAARDPSATSAIDRQIVAVSHYRDSVLADLAARNRVQLEPDLSNLERAMQSAAVTAPQAAPPAVIRPRTYPTATTSAGGYLTVPPQR